MSAIALRGVSKHWTTQHGVVHAVHDLSFELEPGTLDVLLVPSGCGKSTTLRLIAGLENADAGTIVIAGRNVTRLPPAQRSIAMVFPSYALFPHLSVAENIVFGLRVRSIGAAERDQARVADLLGPSALLARKPSQLSGGQQQRVALGRAIINEAPVCLMDEPLSNLDAQLRAEMRGEIRTRHVAISPAAFETPIMKKCVAEFPPAAVARDQLPYAKAELSTHDNQRVAKALNDGLQAALSGTKTPEQAMKDAQREAERLLRSYK